MKPRMTAEKLLPLIQAAVKAQLATNDALRAIETAMGKPGDDLDGVIAAFAAEFSDDASVDTMHVDYARSVISTCFRRKKSRALKFQGPEPKLGIQKEGYGCIEGNEEKS